MRGRAEITDNVLVAIRAFLRPDKLRTGNTRRSHDRSITVQRSAGEESQDESVCSAGAPKQSYAASVEPPNEFGVAHPAGSKKKNHNRQWIFCDKIVTQPFAPTVALLETPDDRLLGPRKPALNLLPRNVCRNKQAHF